MTFIAKTINPANKTVIIKEDHSTKDDFINSLLNRNYKIISVRAAGNGILSINFTNKKLKKETFFAEIYELMSSGINLQQSLEILAKNSINNEIYNQMILKLKKGDSLSSILENMDLFDASEIAMLRSGEDSGNFLEALKMLVSYIEQMSTLKKRILSMLYYPVFLVFLILAVFTYILIFVMPKMLVIFEDLNVELPGYTLTLINFTNTISGNPLISILIIILTSIILYYVYKSYKSQLFMLLLFIPFISKLIKNHILFIFLHPFTIMLQKGVLIKEIISSMKESFKKNEVILNILSKAENKIQKGGKISESFAESDFFSPNQKELIMVSEETASFKKMMDYICRKNDEDYENNLKTLISLFEPAIIILIGAAVLFFIISFILPITNINMNI